MFIFSVAKFWALKVDQKHFFLVVLFAFIYNYILLYGSMVEEESDVKGKQTTATKSKQQQTLQHLYLTY